MSFHELPVSSLPFHCHHIFLTVLNHYYISHKNLQFSNILSDTEMETEWYVQDHCQFDPWGFCSIFLT